VTLPRGRESDERALFPTVYVTAQAAAGLVPADAKPGARLDVVVTDARRRVGGEEGRIPVENVAGFWPGSDPELADEVIILSAHYDHVGTSSSGEIYNGADDNGSGTCGLLAVAEALREYGPMRRSVLLLWVSGEEKGLWGSYAWTTDPWLPEGCRPVCDINIDMIGRNDPDQILLTPTEEHEAFNGLARLVMKLAPEEGFTQLGSADQYWRRSDHMNFNDHLGVPVAFLFTDVHEDYHRPSDTPDKVDYDKMRRVVRLVVRVLDGLQADELDL
jgi:Zn-dependent M28 family amino/carboxypeptidase